MRRISVVLKTSHGDYRAEAYDAGNGLCINREIVGSECGESVDGEKWCVSHIASGYKIPNTVCKTKEDAEACVRVLSGLLDWTGGYDSVISSFNKIHKHKRQDIAMMLYDAGGGLF